MNQLHLLLTVNHSICSTNLSLWSNSMILCLCVCVFVVSVPCQTLCVSRLWYSPPPNSGVLPPGSGHLRWTDLWSSVSHPGLLAPLIQGEMRALRIPSETLFTW